MLAHLQFVRLRAAENALRDGRLDEAFRLATAPDLRDHRRAVAVRAALTERLFERARVHFHAERFTEALTDLDRADLGGVMKDEIAELRHHVMAVYAEQQRKEQARRDRLGAAKRRIEGGSLAAGRQILEEASAHDAAAQRLREEAVGRGDELKTTLERAERAAAVGQWAAAADRVQRAKATDAHHEDVIRVETALCDRVLESAREALAAGRIGRAEDELACLGALGDSLPAKREVADMLALARRVGQSLRTHAYAGARRHAMNLARLLPQATWIKTAVEQLRKLDDLCAEVRSGPLGDVAGSSAPDEAAAGENANPSKASLDDTVALPGRVRTAAALPDRLLLLVDGGGSFLLLRSDRASIGRAAASDPADVPVFSDIAERHANVARVEDDYFLFGTKEVEIGGQRTKHQLLRDGDRVVLGRKAKVTFRLPSRKSPSAVLDLSDTTKMPNDVRRVVLFRQHATIGSGPTAHVYCRHASLPLILFERGGALWIRPKSDGHVATDAQPVKLGEPVEMAGVSLVIEPWEVRSPGKAS
ncbi:MAG: hypothetical protein KJ749_03530 [Planctomycetes bacterium]|nr:hypothetical protein [Planctomycetota bacterium]